MSLLFAIATLGASLVVIPPQSAAPAAPASAQTPTPDVSIQFILTAGPPDGTRGAMAMSEVTSGGTTHVWSETSFCGVGAGNRDVFAQDVIAWRLTGTILQRDADVYTVRLEWTRASGGTGTPPPESPKTVTMRAGERVVLDHVTNPGTSSCAGDLKLEATVGSRSAPNVFRGAGVGAAGGRGIGVGGGRGGGGGRAGGGGAAAAMAGQGSGAGSGTGVGTGGGARGSGSAAAGASASSSATAVTAGRGRGVGAGGRGGGGGAVAAGSTQPDELSRALAGLAAQQSGTLKFGAANPPIDAELWLVHRLPDGTEEVQQLKSRVGDEYTFKPVAVQVPASTVTVDVTGAVYQKYVNGAADGLAVLIRRRIKGTGSDSYELDGSSTSSIATPSPGEVVSFPLPDPVRGQLSTSAGFSAQGRFSLRLDGHSFEIRMRVSPAK